MAEYLFLCINIFCLLCFVKSSAFLFLFLMFKIVISQKWGTICKSPSAVIKLWWKYWKRSNLQQIFRHLLLIFNVLYHISMYIRNSHVSLKFLGTLQSLSIYVYWWTTHVLYCFDCYYFQYWQEVLTVSGLW